jgi:hypothetical protein
VPSWASRLASEISAVIPLPVTWLWLWPLWDLPENLAELMVPVDSALHEMC